MSRKKKNPAPIVAIVMATSPLTGLAPITPAQAAALSSGAAILASPQR